MSCDFMALARGEDERPVRARPTGAGTQARRLLLETGHDAELDRIGERWHCALGG